MLCKLEDLNGFVFEPPCPVRNLIVMRDLPEQCRGGQEIMGVTAVRLAVLLCRNLVRFLSECDA